MIVLIIMTMVFIMVIILSVLFLFRLLLLITLNSCNSHCWFLCSIYLYLIRNSGWILLLLLSSAVIFSLFHGIFKSSSIIRSCSYLLSCVCRWCSLHFIMDYFLSLEDVTTSMVFNVTHTMLSFLLLLLLLLLEFLLLLLLDFTFLFDIVLQLFSIYPQLGEQWMRFILILPNLNLLFIFSFLHFFFSLLHLLLGLFLLLKLLLDVVWLWLSTTLLFHFLPSW